MDGSSEEGAGEERWELNYFNYYTEIEDHFRKTRGTAMFLLSTLDWALIETWKNAGVPLAAVIRGVERAFEKWRARKRRVRKVNSLAYCAQEVLEEAERMAGALPAAAARPPAPPFSLGELRAHLETVAGQLDAGHNADLATAVRELLAAAEHHYGDLQSLELRLTALEDKMIARARARQSDDDLLAARRDLERQLAPYRGKMTADQLAMLERQYLDRRLLESADLPRLSLFYLGIG